MDADLVMFSTDNPFSPLNRVGTAPQSPTMLTIQNRRFERRASMRERTLVAIELATRKAAPPYCVTASDAAEHVSLAAVLQEIGFRTLGIEGRTVSFTD